MPTTRRTSGSNRPTSKQATLSFNHRVTKAAPKSTKSLSSTSTKQSPLAKHVSSTTDPAPAPAPEEEEDVSEVEEEAETKLPTPQKPKSEAELRAEKVSDRQVDQYWRRLEKERIAKRVHQGDLSLAEKVLRYWDVSSQYGPCVGISRMKRWQRAERLGLNPPMEVLAVLMKEEGKGTTGIEKAHMDEILNSTSVGAG